jgi:hypothetical protein
MRPPARWPLNRPGDVHRENLATTVTDFHEQFLEFVADNLLAIEFNGKGLMMKNIVTLSLRLGLLAALLASLLAAPRPASAALGITGVQPGSVSNAIAATLVITGSDFLDGASVVLDGYGALTTTFVNSGVLTAVLPAGAPTGTYTVRVVNANAAVAILPNGLTITGPTATPAPTAFARPLLVVQSYGASSTTIVSNQDYDFEMTFINSGQSSANNIVVTFKGGDFTARGTGGVRALGALGAGQTVRFFQPLTSGSVSGKSLATLDVQVSYTDLNGAGFNETFTLTFDVYQNTGPYATSTPTPTATPKVVLRPQLVITGYRTNVTPLQPGTRFTLELDVQNVGSAKAKRVTLIAGGGTASSGDGTPGAPGGVSGGGGDFANFAPVESSNVQYLGDVASTTPLTVRQSFIVNATTNAGAYPMKFSFVYADEKGVAYTDDQAITLLVYHLPQVDISFYQPLGPFFTFQPSPLPLQIINLGRSSVVLGNMRVSAPNAPGAQLSNNVVLVGNLDVGFPFTLDALVTPDTAGTLELVVTVNYTDDFNQPQTITKTLTVEVMDAPPIVEPTPDPNNPNGIPPVDQPETFWDKVVRFLKGLLGLDSGKPQPVLSPGGGGGNPQPVPTAGPGIIVVPPKG